MYDVVVVGAGPCGTAAARRCAEMGLSTLCLEEHGTIGHPVQCAGLLSIAAWEGCQVSRKSILHQVRGARIMTSDGTDFSLDAGTTKAYVVDRGALDREMAARAVTAGAELQLKTYVRSVEDTTLRTVGMNGQSEVSGRIFIAADGVRSGIARMLGMGRSPVVLAGIQAEIVHEFNPDLVEVHPHASPDFFGWVIPIGKNRARVGLCGGQQVRERFTTFLQHFGTACTDLVTGAIPLGVMPRTYGRRTLFVGDAAGLVKPTSGGGIYTGVRSAMHAAEVATICCETGRFDDEALAEYEHRWRADIGRELALGFRLFELRRTLTVKEVDFILKAFQNPDVVATILRWGDMDRPSKLVTQLIKKPEILRILRILFRSGVCQILK